MCPARDSATSIKIASGLWGIGTMHLHRAGESIFHLTGSEQGKEIFLLFMPMTNIYLSGPDPLHTPVHNHLYFLFLSDFSALHFLFIKVHLGIICLFKCKYRAGEIHRISLPTLS